MSLRILHLGKFFPPDTGGIEFFVADLIEAQRAAGDQAFALVHGSARGDDPSWLRRVQVQHRLLFTPIALGYRAALARAIAEFNPDVLHLHMPNPSVFWALTLADARDLPWVVHWHADVLTGLGGSALALAYRAYAPFEQAVLDRAEAIVSTSLPYLDASVPLLPWREKCTVVPLGVSLRRLHDGVHASGEDNVSDAVAASIESMWTQGVFRVLAMGRLTYYKDFSTLIDAVGSLEGVELLIAGEGELMPVLQARIAALTPVGQRPRIRLLGRVDESVKRALLRDADLFCLPSCERTEAFGMVLLEAMRYGTPCLVSDLPGSGMPWVVARAGAGVTATVGDPVAWRQAIEALRADPARLRAMGESGRAAMLAEFGIDRCAERLDSVYRTVIEDVALIRPTAGPTIAGGMVSVPRNRDILVVIPARDEAATIGDVIARLRDAGYEEVMVIDDHSADTTGDIARAAGAMVLSPVLPLGAWGGMQAGIRYGLRHGYAGVITMDADGQHEVDEIPALLGCRGGADVVIGAHPQRGSAARRIAWRWFRRLSGFGLEDLTSGFRYYNRAAMKVAASSEATLLDYQDIGVLLLLRKAGLRIAEVPVSMNLRLVGRSRIFNSWWTVSRYMAATTLLCLSRWQTRARRLR